MPRTTERGLAEFLFTEEDRNASESFGRWDFARDIILQGGTSSSWADYHLHSTITSPETSPFYVASPPRTSSFPYGSPLRSPPSAEAYDAVRTGVSTTLKQIHPRFSVPKPELYEYERRNLASTLRGLADNSPYRASPRTGAPSESDASDRYGLGSVKRGPLFHETNRVTARRVSDLYVARSAKPKTSKIEKQIEKLTARCSGCSALGHRFHLPGCRYSIEGSVVSVGFVPCYKTH